jgi:hypothetical protein
MSRYVSLIHSLIHQTDHSEEVPFDALTYQIEDVIGSHEGGMDINALLAQTFEECCGSPDGLMNLVSDFELFLVNGKNK